MNHNEKHKALIAYLKMKVEEGDWHGVSDAANDLRVMEAHQAAAFAATQAQILRGMEDGSTIDRP